MSKDIQSEIYRIVGSIEGEVKGMNGRLDRINGTLKAHDNKIDFLEAESNKRKGIVTVIGGIAGVLVSIAWKWAEKAITGK